MIALLFAFFCTLHADQLGLVLPACNVRVNNLLALILLTLLCARGKVSTLSLDRSLFKGFAFIIFAIFISLLGAFDIFRSTLFAGWFGFTIVCYCLLPMLLMNVMREEVLKTYMASFIFVGVYALLQLLLSTKGIMDPFADQTFANGQLVRPNAWAHEPSYYALYMTPFIMMVNLRGIFGSESFLKMLSVNILYLISTSTAVFFAYFLFASVLFLSTFFPWVKCHYPSLRRQIVWLFGSFTAVFLTIFLLFPTFSRQYFLKFFFKGITHHSFHERWQGIKDAFDIFQEHPIFGVGLGSYPPYLMNQWQNGEKSLLIRPDFFVLKNPLKLFEPTNVTMEILASLGILGLCAFGYLGWIYLKRAKFSLQNASSSNERNMSFAFLISMIVTVIVLQFNQGVMRSYIWVHFALSFQYFSQFLERNHTIATSRLEVLN